jgi:hypothetical protein
LGAGRLQPLAHADTGITVEQEDAQFSACIAQAGINRTTALGHAIATDIMVGVRTPSQERDYVYQSHANSINVNDASTVVNCAEAAYTGN